MSVESFSTLTEFAVAIAGFSGIAIVLGTRGTSVEPLFWVRNVTMLTWALGAGFGSILPPLLANFGVEGSSIWLVSGYALGGLCFALVLVPVLAARRLSSVERGRLSPYMWALVLVVTPGVAVWQLLNAGGAFGAPSAGPIYTCVVWLLMFASINFVRMLAQSGSSPDA